MTKNEHFLSIKCHDALQPSHEEIIRAISALIDNKRMKRVDEGKRLIKSSTTIEVGDVFAKRR